MNTIPDDTFFAECADPTLGRKYWAFHADPDSVPEERTRLMLLRHPMVCKCCLERVLNLLAKEQVNTPDGTTDAD